MHHHTIHRCSIGGVGRILNWRFLLKIKRLGKKRMYPEDPVVPFAGKFGNIRLTLMFSFGLQSASYPFDWLKKKRLDILSL